jgi:hypothetical protein
MYNPHALLGEANYPAVVWVLVKKQVLVSTTNFEQNK